MTLIYNPATMRNHTAFFFCIAPLQVRDAYNHLHWISSQHSRNTGHTSAQHRASGVALVTLPAWHGTPQEVAATQKMHSQIMTFLRTGLASTRNRMVETWHESCCVWMHEQRKEHNHESIPTKH